METLLIIIAIAIVSVIASVGYYLILNRDMEKFEAIKETKTEYRTNEEFIKS